MIIRPMEKTVNMELRNTYSSFCLDDNPSGEKNKPSQRCVTHTRGVELFSHNELHSLWDPSPNLQLPLISHPLDPESTFPSSLQGLSHPQHLEPSFHPRRRYGPSTQISRGLSLALRILSARSCFAYKQTKPLSTCRSLLPSSGPIPADLYSTDPVTRPCPARKMAPQPAALHMWASFLLYLLTRSEGLLRRRAYRASGFASTEARWTSSRILLRPAELSINDPKGVGL
jgi:hypothetical protein